VRFFFVWETRMGGGTGSGAAPIVAEIAKDECGCLTVGIVTKPFAFEGKKRMDQAEAAIEEFRKVVDTLIVVSNEKLLEIVPDNTPVTDAFLVADDILRQGIVGISEIIVKAGLVNVDFADVRAVMQNAGTALIGIGKGTGRHRAADAAIAAISSPLLEYPIHKAKRIVFNIVGGNDMGLKEINEASEVIYDNADENSNIIFGATIDPNMSGQISITVLACDFDTSPIPPMPSPVKVPIESPQSAPTDTITSVDDDDIVASAEILSESILFNDNVPHVANGSNNNENAKSVEEQILDQLFLASSTPIDTSDPVASTMTPTTTAVTTTTTSATKGGFRRPPSLQKVTKRQKLQNFLQKVLPKTE
jgi:cell division protein FtsZ